MRIKLSSVDPRAFLSGAALGAVTGAEGAREAYKKLISTGELHPVAMGLAEGVLSSLPLSLALAHAAIRKGGPLGGNLPLLTKSMRERNFLSGSKHLGLALAPILAGLLGRDVIKKNFRDRFGGHPIYSNIDYGMY